MSDSFGLDVVCPRCGVEYVYGSFKIICGHRYWTCPKCGLECWATVDGVRRCVEEK